MKNDKVHRQRKKGAKSGKIDAKSGLLYGLVLLCFLAAGSLGVVAVMNYLKVQKTPKEIPIFSEDDKNRMVEEQTDYERNYYEIIPEDMELFRQYVELNDEVVGIITIRDSILRHPLMQSPTRGECFYLSHDLNRNHNFHGVPFLTLNSDLSREEGNNIIYGHNIIHTEPKDVFCDLVNYEDIGYYKSHPIVELITRQGTAKYIIFSYAIMDTSDSDAFVYWEDVCWEDDKAFNDYMSQMEARNWLDTEVPYSRYDAFITISTCSLELAHSGTNRMVLMARRLEVGENYENYIDNAKMRETPLLPQKLREEEK